MKIVTIVGARPQFVKAAIVSQAFAKLPNVDECIVHTGQHYDEKMSGLFFDELNIPRPRHLLHVGSGSHGKQTGLMLQRVEEVLFKERPDYVLVYGDTNSTVAGALAAAKLKIPVAHVEAGLRSYDRGMPEEINRVVTDHISSLLLCPTKDAVGNLSKEGCHEGVHLVGDVMYDAALFFAEQSADRLDSLATLNWTAGQYVLMTCHRAENTDAPRRIEGILKAANRVAEILPVVFPVHPRTRRLVEEYSGPWHPQLRRLDPVSYLEMLALERNAALIMTDSGGVQKEAFFFGVPCVTMRDETEWRETVAQGANVLAGAEEARLLASVESQLKRRNSLPSAAPFYGDRRAAARIAELLDQRFAR